METIARHARASRPEFLVVPQNGEVLAEEPGYLELDRRPGREDLFFNGDKRQKPKEIKYVQNFVRQFQQAGKPVLADRIPPQAGEPRRGLPPGPGEAGYIALVTVRPVEQIDRDAGT